MTTTHKYGIGIAFYRVDIVTTEPVRLVRPVRAPLSETTKREVHDARHTTNNLNTQIWTKYCLNVALI